MVGVGYAKYWNTKRAAAFLGVSSHTLEKWRAKERGPRYHRLGGMIRYVQADLEAFQAESVVDPMDAKP